MSTEYRVEVNTVSCAPGTWTGNAIRFNEADECEEAARDLFMRWTAVKYWRVIDDQDVVHASNDPEQLS